MGFWNKLGKLGEEALDFLVDTMEEAQLSQLYPSLQAAICEYIDADGYYVSRCAPPFEVVLEKPGVFGKKTVTLTVLENGSVHIVESGVLGKKWIFPKTAGTPIPEQWIQGARHRAPGEG